MAFQAVPDVAQVRFHLVGDNSTQMGGSVADFSLYVRDEVTPHWNDTNVANLSAYALDWWETVFAESVDEDWILDQLTVKDLSSEFGEQLFVDGIGSHGTRSGAASPPQVCCWYLMRGDSGSPPKRGGVFLPAGVEEDIDVNVWTGSFLTQIDNRMGAWFDGLAGERASWAGVIVSRFASTSDAVKEARAALRAAIAATKRAEGVSNTISSRGARALLASQRDRRTGIPG